MFLAASDYGDSLDIWPLRGNLRTLAELGAEFDKIEPGYYQAIIFDAKYRFALEGVSENENAAETQLYNLLDKISERLQASPDTYPPFQQRRPIGKASHRRWQRCWCPESGC